MKQEFAHLDQSWILENYTPDMPNKHDIFFALTNTGILFPGYWNKLLANKVCQKGISGKDIYDYIEKTNVDVLFERQIYPSKGYGRSGTLRQGTNSKFYKFYTPNNLETLKKGLLSRIEFNKIYYTDADLYFLGDGLFVDAYQIHPLFAASFSQIREVKYAVQYYGRSQVRDRFTYKKYQELINGIITLKAPNNYNYFIIPEYELYLIRKYRKIYIITRTTKEKKMAVDTRFKLNNKIRRKNRLENVTKILNYNNNLKLSQIAQELMKFEDGFDANNEKNVSNLKRSLNNMVKNKNIKQKKKKIKGKIVKIYSLPTNSTKKQKKNTKSKELSKPLCVESMKCDSSNSCNSSKTFFQHIFSFLRIK